MDEIDALVAAVNDKLVKINKTTYVNDEKDRRKKGDMGEAFGRYCIKQCLFNRGYKLSTGGPQTFKIIKRHMAEQEGPRKGEGGIDFFLTVNASDGTAHEFFIEFKNWGHYPISHLFEKDILSRFTDHDPGKKRHWIVTMNKRNIEDIKEPCRQNDITIIPIEQHVTSYFLGPNPVDGSYPLKTTIRKFIEDFTYYFNHVLYDTTAVQQFELQQKMRTEKTEKLKADILQGKDYNVLALKYDFEDVSYVKELKHKMKKQGEDVPDRRKNGWKDIEFKTHV